jgi:peptidyl-prolyl cis-trans isomerase B (cyclophilin B)
MRLPIPILLATTIALGAAGCGSSSHDSPKAAAQATASTPTTATAPAVTTSTASTSTAASAPTIPGCTKAPDPTAYASRTHESVPTGRLSATRQWTVTLDTNCGKIAIALAVKQAPKTTSAFAGLVRRGFFTGLSFHRIVAGFVIQGGDPLQTGAGGPGYTVVEAPPSDLKYTSGVVAMAKTSTDPSGASGSQFFIVTGADAQLPAEYALLGRVSSGMAVAKRIEAVPTQPSQMPDVPIIIRRATLTSH